jgi:hypothetical protein
LFSLVQSANEDIDTAIKKVTAQGMMRSTFSGYSGLPYLRSFEKYPTTS